MIKQQLFLNVARTPVDHDSLDNKILLCRDCAGEYFVDPSAGEYRNPSMKKKQQREDLSLQDKVDDIDVEKGIREILDALADMKRPPGPIEKSKWDSYRVDKKIAR